MLRVDAPVVGNRKPVHLVLNPLNKVEALTAGVKVNVGIFAPK